MGRIFSISEKKKDILIFFGSTPEVLSELRINLKKKNILN